MKWYKVNTEKVLVIGDCNYFEGNTFEYNDYGFGYFRGMAVKNCLRGCFDSKEKAVMSAKENYINNKPFVDGSIPFEIVFKTKQGWQVMTSNICDNANMIKKNMVGGC